MRSLTLADVHRRVVVPNRAHQHPARGVVRAHNRSRVQNRTACTACRAAQLVESPYWALIARDSAGRHACTVCVEDVVTGKVSSRAAATDSRCDSVGKGPGAAVSAVRSTATWLLLPDRALAAPNACHCNGIVLPFRPGPMLPLSFTYWPPCRVGTRFHIQQYTFARAGTVMGPI